LRVGYREIPAAVLADEKGALTGALFFILDE
jgi:hypothetical protein